MKHESVSLVPAPGDPVARERYLKNNRQFPYEGFERCTAGALAQEDSVWSVLVSYSSCLYDHRIHFC